MPHHRSVVVGAQTKGLPESRIKQILMENGERLGVQIRVEHSRSEDDGRRRVYRAGALLPAHREAATSATLARVSVVQIARARVVVALERTAR